MASNIQAIIDDHMRIIAETVRNDAGEKIAALVLGGGYGRGEGGVIETADGPRPYNDYDLVGLTTGSIDELGDLPQKWHKELSAACGIHVDITPIPVERVPHLPPALTWYELGQGHRLVYGPTECMRPLQDRKLDDVHPTEWGRLLVNRGCGLFFARNHAEPELADVIDGEHPASFQTRQLAKAWLALGDVFLADRGKYTPLVNERRTAMETLADRPEWVEQYFKACEFKFAPKPEYWSDCQADLAILSSHIARALEGHPCADNKPLKSCYHTLRNLAPGQWWPLFLYPRERLRRVLMTEPDQQKQAAQQWLGGLQQFASIWLRFG